MSNEETNPAEVACRPCQTDDLDVVEPREVPLGGLRAMTVRRTLPTRQRSLIGAWCFLDHYGPDQVAGPDGTGGMNVAPHPHTGLQTVSWLFEGEIEHRDSAGHHAMVRPGELNLMTAGHGISHSEVSTSSTSVLHGAQLWVALPEGSRDCTPTFEHYAPQELQLEGGTAKVFLGQALGDRSPVTTATPLLGVEITLESGASIEVDLDPAYEVGVLVDAGTPQVAGHTAKADQLIYLAPGRSSVRITAGDEATRVLVLGGPPFGDSIVMWWNFVGRSHEEVVEYRRAWQEQAEGDYTDGRFGIPVGNELDPIPAPELPNARLRERR